MGAEHRSVPVVAIGASAGGVTALTTLAESLPATIDAAILVVLHITPTGPSMLPEILARACALPAKHAVDGDAVAPGRIYIAPPDHHLLLAGDHLHVSRSPRENGVRPSVDALFRSVARERGRRAVGVILSGTLDDGTAGLAAMGDVGAATVVQDPAEAAFPGMPESARRYASPLFVVTLAEMGQLVAKLVDELPDLDPSADDPRAVVELDARTELERGDPSAFTCPECGGTLFEQQVDSILQFRCRVGHGYVADSLLLAQKEKLEGALYAAIVALEERADLSRRMGRRMEQAGRRHIADRYFVQAEETERQASVVRDAVGQLRMSTDNEQP